MKKRLVLIVALGISVLLMACQQRTVETEISSKEMQSIEINDIGELSEATETELSQEEPVNEEEVIVADYSVCTDKTVQEVESFAKQVSEYFVSEDWNSLAQIIYYPITINEKYYADKEKFLAEDWSNAFSASFKKSISEAQTSNMFANWQGISFADGGIWINEFGSDLYVSSINYYDGTNVADESSGIVGHWNLDLKKTEDNLKEYSSAMELLGSGAHIGGSLDINEDGTFELSLAISDYMKGTYSQSDSEINLIYTDGFGENGETTISYENIDGTFYIISDYAGEQIFWAKLAE